MMAAVRTDFAFEVIDPSGFVLTIFSEPPA
jgi:hypothetical protein